MASELPTSAMIQTIASSFPHMVQTIPTPDCPVDRIGPTLDNPETAVLERMRFIKNRVRDVDPDDVVVTLTGTSRSTLAATLAVQALDPATVSGLILTTQTTGDDSLAAAEHAAADLDITYHTMDVTPFAESFAHLVCRAHNRITPSTMLSNGSLHRANCQQQNSAVHSSMVHETAARCCRKLAAFVTANAQSRLILDPSTRTSLLLGSTPIVASADVDLLPLGDLYQTEVQELASYLDTPPIHNETSEYGLTCGKQEGESDSPVSHKTIDRILWQLVDDGAGIEETATILDVAPELVGHIAVRYARRAKHYTKLPIPNASPSKRRAC